MNGRRILLAAGAALLVSALPHSAAAATATQTGLASSLNPSQYGQRVILTASVAPLAGATTPTGSITFTDGSATVATIPLDVNGQATLVLSTPSAGTHPFTATYGGDATNAGSASPVLDQIVQPATSATSLSVAPNPATPTSQVVLSAVVTAPCCGLTPSGTVRFADGSATLGTVTLDANGHASLTTTLPAGTHSLVAAYAGTANIAPSTSPTVSETVAGSPAACGSAGHHDRDCHDEDRDHGSDRDGESRGRRHDDERDDREEYRSRHHTF